VSEQISGTHGPAEDDAIKRQDRGEAREYAEEWPEPESPDEGDPDAAWAETGRFAGAPEGENWEAIELRSDLARHLDRAAFPVSREELIETLQARQAEQRLLDKVSSLPAGATFGSLHDLVRALGLPVEQRPA
jgi:Protein of unknown function (DUF2795)